MDFVAVVDQVIVLLRERGRMTYRTLQRQFQLDDDALHDLTDEILYAHPEVRDDAGRGLVWTGDTETPVPPASSSPLYTPLPAASSPPEAERRQLTVLFCDLVDSTALASQLDPEDLREVVRAYQDTCAKVIARFDGYIAQYLGDGLLVYFGYPQAHEDDVQRAGRTGLVPHPLLILGYSRFNFVRASSMLNCQSPPRCLALVLSAQSPIPTPVFSVVEALGILDAMGSLNARLEQERGVRLAVRVGVHTGSVVVGTMGSGGRQEQLALGDTPNIAARLQGLAASNTVVVSAATLGLIEGFFTYQALGEYALKGVEEPLRVSQLLAESGAQTRLDVVPPRSWTLLVGRAQEVGLLLERWARSTEGHGQVVLLSGEAGIGKSRLVEVLRARVGRERATWLTFRCSPYHTNSALYPVITHLQRVLQLRPEETPAEQLDRLEHSLQATRLPLAEVVPLVAALLSVPLAERYPPLDWSSQKQRQKTQEALVAWLLAEAERQPVLAVWEDLHWADPSTLEWLGLVLDQTPTAPLCTLLTYRPEFPLPWAPRSYLTQLTLSRLPRPQVEEMLQQLTGSKRLPAEVVRQIVAKTDGVPLFVEELTKTVLEADWLQEREDRYELTGGPLPTLAIPATLQDTLRARLDRLPEGKAVAQLGAVLGRTFAYELLRAVSPLDELALWRGLVQLVQAEVLYQRGMPPPATYTFKHALLQEAAYQSLLRSTRQHYHRRTAQVMVEHFPDLAETQPELLAQHYTEAGLAEEAVESWQRAGERSNARSAYVEVVEHCTKGLEVLKTLPDTPARAQRELNLLLNLAGALRVTKGFAALEVWQAFARARELCHHVEDTPQLCDILIGLYAFYQNRGELQTSRELMEQALSLAQRLHDPVRLINAHANLGISLGFVGEFVSAYPHLEQALTLTVTQPFSGQRARGLALAYAAYTLWMLGYPDQALTRNHEALMLAQGSSRAFDLARALDYATLFHELRRDVSTAQALAEAALALSTEQGFAQLVGQVTFRRAWALAAQGQHEVGIAQMHQGLAARRATGSVVRLSEYLARLAEVYGESGQAEAGLRLLAEALAHVDATGERHFEAEVYRVKGELLLRQAIADIPQAEACFHQALAVARRQQAKSWELRAALSLSRLWQQQGKRAEASALLAPIYGWFTEGFDTADLQDAKALLDELGG